MTRRTILLLLLGLGAWGAEYPFARNALDHRRELVVGVDGLAHIYVGYGQDTLVEFPENETILQVIGLDTGQFWGVTKTGDNKFLSIKPKQARISGSLNIVTTHTVYTVYLEEVSGTKQPYDVRVRLTPDDRLQAKVDGPPAYVSAAQNKADVDRWKTEAENEKAAVAKAEEQSKAELERYRADYVRQIRHPYVWDRRAGAKLGLEDIWCDDHHMYARINTQEAGALYQVSDGKVRMTWAPLKDGVYTVDKVLRQGELALGKTKVRFIDAERRRTD